MTCARMRCEILTDQQQCSTVSVCCDIVIFVQWETEEKKPSIKVFFCYFIASRCVGPSALSTAVCRTLCVVDVVVRCRRSTLESTEK